MNMMNPMLGLDMNDEQQKQMLALALMQGGAAAMQNQTGRGLAPLGSGVQAMMGSLQGQQQMALLAQMQALQRKDIQSGMEARTTASEQRAQQHNDRMEQERQRLELEERRVGIAEKARTAQMDEYGRKQQLEKDRMASAQNIRKLMEGDAPEQEVAEAVMYHTMMYGGSPSGNVSNVLFPSGKSGTGSMLDLLMGGGMPGGAPGGMPGGAPGGTPQMPPMKAPDVGNAANLQEGLQIGADIDVAKQAAQMAHAKEIEAQRFVTNILPRMEAKRGWVAPSKEDAATVIKQAEELFPAMSPAQKRKTAEAIKELKERFGL